MTLEVPRVHAVTNQEIAAGPDLDAIASGLAVSPMVALHARIPRGEGRALFDLATRFLKTAATVMVNDRADVALISGVAGVHLPADGLPVGAARQLLPAGCLVGRSAHSADEARRAADEGADYVFLGPIWETPSHADRKPLGLAALRNAGTIKVIAIGGVGPARSAQCRDAGAWGVAAVSALWNAPDPRAAVESMLLSFQ